MKMKKMKKILLFSLLFTQLTIHANQVANPASNNTKEKALAFTEKENSLVQSIHADLNIPVDKIIKFTFRDFQSLVLSKDLKQLLNAYTFDLIKTKPIYQGLANTENYFGHAMRTTDYMFPTLYANPQLVSAFSKSDASAFENAKELALKKKKLDLTWLESMGGDTKQNSLVQALHTATTIPIDKIINFTFKDLPGLPLQPTVTIREKDNASGLFHEKYQALSSDLTKQLVAHIKEKNIKRRLPSENILKDTDYIFPSFHAQELEKIKQQELAFTNKQNSLIQSLHTETNIPVNKIIKFTLDNFSKIEQPQALLFFPLKGEWYITLSTNLTKLLVAYRQDMVQNGHAMLNTDYMFPNLNTNAPPSVSAYQLAVKHKAEEPEKRKQKAIELLKEEEKSILLEIEKDQALTNLESKK